MSRTKSTVNGSSDSSYLGALKQLRRMHSSNMCGRHLRATKCHEKSSCSTNCPEMRLERSNAQRYVRISTDPKRFT